MKLFYSIAAAALGLMIFTGSATEAEASPYGCFVVTTDSLNIRARPRAASDVVGMAKKGDILEKRKLICTPRGFWCAIRKGSIEGYADKNFMRRVKCPG
ncbi:SH3 domain-containing protein [Hyphomicrobium sp.]|uniref:SH3 domain-containing protein n=1 Tax=Hyphomicrobium sp. TaxID=82 RepID=UPI002BA921D3|nr:SH3 domain-containing protein [Hyphomicrobium sp.]HRN89462.1 SH3 domain-containing protein [Hyphomicrobium sp.]HRQ26540.1 SH3 domain-containing protein [Hyphomicrobium sp.]